MNVKNLYDYYSFGYNYHSLLTGKMGSSNDEVMASLTEYGKFLRENNLDVTVSAVYDDFVKLYESVSKKKGSDKFNEDDNSALVKCLKMADTTLDAELKTREAYILTEKRYALKKLLRGVDDLFAKDVFSKLSEIAKFDFYEAGKCIAFERPTAAAFHLLRGTEATVRDYYYKIVKRKRAVNATWGTMTTELRTKRKSSTLLLQSLDYIRINYRNPTQHPELRYTLEEAEDLFGLCIDSINKLVKEIHKS